MTPKEQIQDRLQLIAEEMDVAADLMRAYKPTTQRMLTHAGELSGAADLCREWVEEMDGDT